MFLKNLYLRHFRSYTEAEVSFSPGINVLHGDNAQGKTNLLEAIYLIATGRSFRAEQLYELIQQGAPFFFIEAIVVKEGIEHTVQITFDGTIKKVTLDNNAYGTFQHLIGLLPSVLYTPSDAELIDGSPATRRRFLNIHLAQRDPLYIHHLARYWRAMKQRNTQLKSKQLEGIEAWETEMAISADYLLHSRQLFAQELHIPLREMAQRLAGKDELHEIRFHPSHPPTVESYLIQLKKNRFREQQLGATLTGPHRDDFTLWIDGKPARSFASEGQKKTAVAALRMTEWNVLTQSCGSRALLGVDDLGLHLDPNRQSLLRTLLGSMGQVFVTLPKRPDRPEFNEARKFHVSAGRVLLQNP